MKKIILVLLSCCSMAFGADKTPAKKIADTIYCNGNIYSGLRLNASRYVMKGEVYASMAGVPAMSVAGDRILNLGTCNALRKSAGPKTKIVDLHGAFVMPGFNDA